MMEKARRVQYKKITDFSFCERPTVNEKGRFNVIYINNPFKHDVYAIKPPDDDIGITKQTIEFAFDIPSQDQTYGNYTKEAIAIIRESFGTCDLMTIKSRLIIDGIDVEKLSLDDLAFIATEKCKTPIKKDVEIKPPLGEIAGLIYEKLKSLPEHKAMNTREIADWLAQEHDTILDESTINKNHIPQLKPYGLYSRKRIGHCIRQ